MRATSVAHSLVPTLPADHAEITAAFGPAKAWRAQLTLLTRQRDEFLARVNAAHPDKRNAHMPTPSERKRITQFKHLIANAEAQLSEALRSDEAYAHVEAEQAKAAARHIAQHKLAQRAKRAADLHATRMRKRKRLSNLLLDRVDDLFIHLTITTPPAERDPSLVARTQRRMVRVGRIYNKYHQQKDA